MTDTGQTACFNLDCEIECAAAGTGFVGKGGQLSGTPACFAVDTDGLVTGEGDTAQAPAPKAAWSGGSCLGR
ncbi:hypothetical protein EGN72_06725 [Pseudorhodobacter sp. E13]|nr:hypothetical protein EGN72_06725 [Pseudorhodobacter sp. E13]